MTDSGSQVGFVRNFHSGSSSWISVHQPRPLWYGALPRIVRVVEDGRCTTPRRKRGSTRYPRATTRSVAASRRYQTLTRSTDDVIGLAGEIRREAGYSQARFGPISARSSIGAGMASRCMHQGWRRHKPALAVHDGGLPALGLVDVTVVDVRRGERRSRQLKPSGCLAWKRPGARWRNAAEGRWGGHGFGDGGFTLGRRWAWRPRRFSKRAMSASMRGGGRANGRGAREFADSDVRNVDPLARSAIRPGGARGAVELERLIRAARSLVRS